MAILDNFHYQPYVANRFGKNYLLGLEVANKKAKSLGYQIQYKVFNYDRNEPLAVFEAAQKVKKWQPDVVIGPRDSNHLLLLKDVFKDVLVLSPFATSKETLKLPSNFYSLTLPDYYEAKAIFDFFIKTFPARDIFAVIEADCKSCIDVSNYFQKLYQKHFPDRHFRKTYLLQDNVEKINMKTLLKHYKQGDIILLPNTAYTTAVLMLRITNFLNAKTVFVGGDGWGAWENTQVGKLHASKPYYGIHITPSSLDMPDPLIRQFKWDYQHVFHNQPKGNAALLAYATIYSVIEALRKYGNEFKNYPLKIKALKSYLAARRDHPNWFRNKKYAVYHISPKGAHFISTESVLTNKE